MKTKKAKLRSKADRLWYLKYLKARCEVCGGSGLMQGHHFYYRSSYNHLRYEKQNHITLCRGCHFLLHHRDPKTVESKIIEKRGRKWLKELEKKAKIKPPPSYLKVAFYENIIKELTK